MLDSPGSLCTRGPTSEEGLRKGWVVQSGCLGILHDDDKTCPSVASWEATNGRKHEPNPLFVDIFVSLLQRLSLIRSAQRKQNSRAAASGLPFQSLQRRSESA